MQAGETRRKHEIHSFIDRGLAVAETERAKATLVSYTTSSHLLHCTALFFNAAVTVRLCIAALPWPAQAI